MSSTVYQIKESKVSKQWWALFGICVFYSFYALYMGGIALALELGLVTDAPERGVQSVFVIHALSGAVVLVSGALQFNRQLLINNRALHRWLGRTYVVMVWLSSLGGLWLTFFFDVSPVAKVIFGVLAILWFGTTTRAFICATKGKIKSHREWMIRSFALSFFFVTFSFWVDGLAAILPEGMAYPVAVFMSWGLNLAVAEIKIRKLRKES